ncbi:MAG: hypothetical protein AAFU85_16390 [Planctomycetota bacterium]
MSQRNHRKAPRIESLEGRKLFAADAGIGTVDPIETGFTTGKEYDNPEAAIVSVGRPGDLEMGRNDDYGPIRVVDANEPAASVAVAEGRLADEHLGVVRWQSIDEYYAALGRLEEIVADLNLPQAEGFHDDGSVPTPGSKLDPWILANGAGSTPLNGPLPTTPATGSGGSDASSVPTSPGAPVPGPGIGPFCY